MESESGDEIRRVRPDVGGITFERLERGGLCWPCPTEDHPDTSVPYESDFRVGRALLPIINDRPSPDSSAPILERVPATAQRGHGIPLAPWGAKSNSDLQFARKRCSVYRGFGSPPGTRQKMTRAAFPSRGGQASLSSECLRRLDASGAHELRSGADACDGSLSLVHVRDGIVVGGARWRHRARRRAVAPEKRPGRRGRKSRPGCRC
jgi:hypothetical protein